MRPLRSIIAGTADFARQLAGYRGLSPDRRHLLWKKPQAAAAFAAFPLMVAWGAVRRLRGSGARRVRG
jgi:hypothetical protein